ncbi:putative E3 ubiquitin-protein ligase BAH1 [Helianthus annuus]|nr:putative E3 ubiquitin-protein ligase BAH1 [Helianthus annuus]
MKFCKKYEEYMQTHDQKKLPGVGFKNLKKILKRCRSDVSRSQKLLLRDDDGNKSPSCVHHCAVCDGSFFPSLTKEMSMVVGCFNECAQKVLDVHLASGFRKYFLWCTDKLQRNHGALIQEGKDLVGYAIINAIAMRKILKKYDKIHDSKQGQAFRSQVQSMHMEILQSPWLYELIAFHINLRERKGIMGKDSKLFEGCGIIFNDGKPSLSCELSHAVKLEIDLTCSICLGLRGSSSRLITTAYLLGFSLLPISHTIMSRHPEVKWAQREDKVFITVVLADTKDAKVNLAPEGVFTFSAKAGQHEYDLKLELFDKVNVEESKINIGERSIFCILEKAEAKWWSKLLSGDAKTPHYVKVDWDKWADEDDDAGPADLDMGGMDFSKFGDMGGMGMPGMGGMGMPGMGGMGMPGMGGMGMPGMGGMGMPNMDEFMGGDDEDTDDEGQETGATSKAAEAVSEEKTEGAAAST